MPSGALPHFCFQVSGAECLARSGSVHNKSGNRRSPAALLLLRMTHIIPGRSSMPGRSDHLFLCPRVCEAGRPASATSDSEDENPEALQPLRPPRPLGNYSLCEQGEPAALHFATPPPSPREAERSAVVINQPAPLTSPHQASADTTIHSSDSVRNTN